MSLDLCECGCGEPVNPGKRFVYNHYPRVIRRDEPAEMAECQRCGRKAWVRQDGTLGAHFASSRKASPRLRCSGGGQPTLRRTQRSGRRVTVSIDVVLPDGWDLPRFKAEAAQVLRAHLDEPFVVSLDAEEAS